MDRVKGKVALITGGGAGLGRAMALRFIEEGASVIIGDVNEGALAETSGLVARMGAEDAILARRMDVTSEADCQGAVAAAVERWGKLDILCANAGIGGADRTLSPIAELEQASWERVLAINLTGVFLSAKHAFRAMQGAGGAIVITASVAGLHGTPGLGAYGPSKAAVIQLMQTLALEGARYGIRANALCPIWTQTAMVDEFVDAFPGAADRIRQRLIASIPLGRMGAPLDVANAALYLASDEAAFISGVALPVDGGHMASR
jgi:NAD(P)-dependent dehydrogenase (short-subunit alcohol dehydrogenase family)